MKLTRNLLLSATLLQALTLPLLLAPSFAQQEINPTWHDPSAVTTPATARSVQPAANGKKTGARAHTSSANQQQVSKQESKVTDHEHKQATKEVSTASSL